MLGLGAVVMNVSDVDRAGAFWSARSAGTGGASDLARRAEGGWGQPDDADFVVLADPDGNLFCVIA